MIERCFIVNDSYVLQCLVLKHRLTSISGSSKFIALSSFDTSNCFDRGGYLWKTFVAQFTYRSSQISILTQCNITIPCTKGGLHETTLTLSSRLWRQADNNY